MLSQKLDNFFFFLKSCIWLISVWNAKEKHKLLGTFLAELLCETTALAIPALQMLWSRCSLQRGFTENGGWKGPLQVIWSNPLLGQWPSARASCSGLCPGRFWRSPRMQTPQPLWLLQYLTTPMIKNCFIVFRLNSMCPVCAHCLSPWHWAPVKRAWLQLLCTLPAGIFIHG